MFWKLNYWTQNAQKSYPESSNMPHDATRHGLSRLYVSWNVWGLREGVPQCEHAMYLGDDAPQTLNFKRLFTWALSTCMN